MKKIISILVLLSILLAAISVASAQGGEIKVGVPFKGIASGQAINHSFTATAGQFLIINLKSEVFDPRLTLSDATGAELASDDDGGANYDSLIVFMVPSDGTYQLLVDSWSDATGDYVLSVDPASTTPLTIGEKVSLASNGTSPIYGTFTGTKNQVVNVGVTSLAGEDSRLRVLGSAGQVLWEDDDSGLDSNPYLRRIVLPSEGPYFVEVSPFGEEGLTSNVDVTVEATENLPLTSTPQTVSLDAALIDKEVLTLDVVSGTVYRIQVQITSGDSVRVEIATGDDFFSPSMEITQGAGGSWDYRATSTGVLRVSLSASFFGYAGTYQISAESIQ